MPQTTSEHLARLHQIRAMTGDPTTLGVPDEAVSAFLDRDPDLARAIDEAHHALSGLDDEEAALVTLDEAELYRRLQDRYVNFYPAEGVCPYVPVAARGPWIVTSHGAVLHDSGGYGMLGLGHSPDVLLAELGRPWPMANVMTPSFSQKRFADRLQNEIGHRRGSCPFSRFVCMNSGSEAVTITSRIVDIHARQETDPGARYEGRRIRRLALAGGFHGRTSAPAWMSHSTREVYEEHLASFRAEGRVDFVPVNDVEALAKAFEDAAATDVFYEAVYVEPVMGEGVPGLALSREFYDAARRLTQEHDSMLVVDSIQAALRAHGCLSIVDYPGFEDCDAPDMETYSKALNAGQFPLSVVALRERAAELYVTGVYGNTMTTNPRALEVGCAVLEAVDDRLRRNIRDRGEELRSKLEELGRARPDAVRSVVGTGLMVCAELDPDRYPVTGHGGVEEFLRIHGIQMIHGGDNGIRFTPSFGITSAEIDLIVGVVRQALEQLGGS